MKVLKFSLEPSVYPIEILIWIGPWSDAGVDRFIKKKGFRGRVEPPSAVNAGCCWGMGMGRASMIWLPRFPIKPFEHGMLAHEALHATQNAAEYLGFKLSEKSEEFYSYMIGYIVSEVHLQHDKTRKGVRRKEQLRSRNSPRNGAVAQHDTGAEIQEQGRVP